MLLKKLIEIRFLASFLGIDLFQVVHLGFENLRIIHEFLGVELFFQLLETFPVVLIFK